MRGYCRALRSERQVREINVLWLFENHASTSSNCAASFAHKPKCANPSRIYSEKEQTRNTGTLGQKHDRILPHFHSSMFYLALLHAPMCTDTSSCLSLLPAGLQAKFSNLPPSHYRVKLSWCNESLVEESVWCERVLCKPVLRIVRLRGLDLANCVQYFEAGRWSTIKGQC